MENLNFRNLPCVCWEKGICNEEKRLVGERRCDFAPKEIKYPDCKDNCWTHKNISVMTQSCGIDFKQVIKTLVPLPDDRPVFQRLREIKYNSIPFVKNGGNIYITSSHVENGKTTSGNKIMFSYFWQMVKWPSPDEGLGKYINIPEFLMDYDLYTNRSSTAFKRKIEEIKKVDIVVWDDITSQILSPQQQAVLNALINPRFRDKKSNIFIGLEVNNLQETVGALLAQRLKSCEKLVISKKYKKMENISVEDEQYCL